MAENHDSDTPSVKSEESGDSKSDDSESSNSEPVEIVGQVYEPVRRSAVRESLFYFGRRVVLTFTLFLAMVLVLLELMSFNIDLFYTYQRTDESKSLTGSEKFGKRVGLVAIVLVVFLVGSRLISKGYGLAAAIWDNEGFGVLGHHFASGLTHGILSCVCPCCKCCADSKSPSAIAARHRFQRYVSWTIQAIVIIWWEVLPLIGTVVLLFVVKDSQFGAGSYTAPLEYYLLLSAFAALVLCMVWFASETLENWRRILVILVGGCRVGVILDEMVQKKKDKKAIWKLKEEGDGDGDGEASAGALAPFFSSPVEEEIEVEAVLVEDDDADDVEEESEGEWEEEEEEEGELCSEGEEEAGEEEEEGGDAGVEEDEAEIATSPSTATKDDPDDEDLEDYSSDAPILEPEGGFFDEPSLCVLMIYICCCWVPHPRCGFSFRTLWVILGSIALIVAMSILAGIVSWQLTIVLVMFVVIVAFDIVLRLFVSIPRHSPHHKRARHYEKNNENIFGRFVLLVEEVAYTSPAVVFTVCKVVTYVLLLAIVAFSIFGITNPVYFVLPILNFIFVGLMYGLRFNLYHLTHPSMWYLVKWCRDRKRARQPGGDDDEEENEPQGDVELKEEGIDVDVDVAPADVDAVDEAAPAAAAGKHPVKKHKRIHHLENPVFRVLSVLSYVISIFLWFIGLVIFVFVYVYWIAGLFGIVFFALLCCIVFERHYPKQAVVRILVFVLLVVVFCGILLIGYGPSHNVLTQADLTGIETLMNTSFDDAKESMTLDEPSVHRKYKVCDVLWPGGDLSTSNTSFGVIDFAIISVMSYYLEVNSLNRLLDKYLPNCPQCEIAKIGNETVFFADIYDPVRDISIIAVRGTDSSLDIIQDVYIWKEIGLLQAFASLTPVNILTKMAKTTTAKLIYYLSLFETFFVKPEDQYYNLLNVYVEQRKTEVGHVFLTGHSLGGGVAKIVGALQNLSSIAFASPGLTFSAYKLGFDPETVNRIATNVKPNLDVVSSIDEVGGEVQHIACLFDDFLSCHAVYGMADVLIHDCGDPFGRWVPADKNNPFFSDSHPFSPKIQIRGKIDKPDIAPESLSFYQLPSYGGSTNEVQTNDVPHSVMTIILSCPKRPTIITNLSSASSTHLP